MPTQLPPLTGDDELDQFNYDVSQELNNLSTATGDVEVTTDNQARPIIDGNVLGYQSRFLEAAYGTDANGAGFSQTVSGLPAGSTELWQGLRNQDTNTSTSNPADFTWRQIIGFADINTVNASYRTIGGREIDWNFTTAVPAGFTIDTGPVIDLDSLPGAAGEDGDDNVSVLIENTTENGDAFRNGEGATKTYEATVLFGGERLTDADHAGFIFTWRYNATIVQGPVTGATGRTYSTTSTEINNAPGRLAQLTCQVICT